MKILVIGGSYFLGKCFVEAAAKEHEIHVINRGTRPLHVSNITEYKVDRHDSDGLSKIPHNDFDVIVDFCAYQPGDIRTILTNISSTCSQYIFISTCDVYERNTMQYMDETSPMESRIFGGEAGEYIKGKIALEKELTDCCKEFSVTYTSFRPAFIYGPGNYAPREGIYFRWITNAGQIIHPTDSTGEFQMVYVQDVVSFILAACCNPVAYNKAYNLCNPEMLTYDSFADILSEATAIPFEKACVTVAQIMEKGIPLPFPLTKEESQYYKSDLSNELNVSYTPIKIGMKETFSAYQQVNKTICKK